MKNQPSKTSQKNIENNYQKLLENIQNCIKQTGENIANLVVRKKLEMCWQIGRLIEENLLTNNQAGYGDKIFSKLAQDIAIKRTALYQMHNFYQAYKTLPKDENGLNWTHYRTLAEITDADQREYLTHLAIENSWSTRELESEASKIKDKQSEEAFVKVDGKSNNDKTNKTKPKPPKLGKLFCYQMISFEDSAQIYVDCGFHIFRSVETNIKSGEIVAGEIVAVEIVAGEMVEAVKKDVASEDEYSFVKSNFSPTRLFTYKAKLERVVDGDTIRVILDLGFKIYHRQILRLREVYAPEIATKDGKLAFQKLSKILQDIPFLIIKTSQIDIYGRYVADVFLGKDGLEIGDDGNFRGEYLNEMLAG